MFFRFVIVIALCCFWRPSHPTGVISHVRSWHSTALSDFADFIHFDQMWKYHFTADGVNWQLNFNDLLISPLSDHIRELVGVDSAQVQFQNATGRVLRRGDDVAVNRICTQSGQSGTVVILVLFAPSGPNDYGEIMFFDEAINDIELTIRPAAFSVISFPCTQAYQWQYPAIGTQKGLGFIQFLFIEKGWVVEGKEIDNSHLPLVLDPYTKLAESDLHIKVTTSFNLTADKPVFVIDDLFESATLSELASHFLLSSAYIYNEEDDGGETDNVVFLTPHPTYHLVKTGVWAVFERVMEHVTGTTGWYPYDVCNNLNEAWDHTRIHPDCFGRDDYTILLYLNSDYEPGHLGGTVWYTDESGEEIVGSVMNKFGRLAVFHCSIPHSARPPHATVRGPRLTFAVKVSPSKLKAVVRAMSESQMVNGHERPEEEFEEELFSEFQGKYKGDVDMLEAVFRKAVEEFWEEHKDMFKEVLQSAGEELDEHYRDEL